MSKLRRVWVVLGNHDYESNNVLRVSRKLRRAEAFQKRCCAHDKIMPQHPYISKHGDDVSDADYEAWRKLWDAWEAKHPAKQRYDSYSIMSVGFDDAD